MLHINSRWLDFLPTAHNFPVHISLNVSTAFKLNVDYLLQHYLCFNFQKNLTKINLFLNCKIHLKFKCMELQESISVPVGVKGNKYIEKYLLFPFANLF